MQQHIEKTREWNGPGPLGFSDVSRANWTRAGRSRYDIDR